MTEDATPTRPNQYMGLPIDAVVSVVNNRDLLVQTGKTFQVHEFMFQLSRHCTPPHVQRNEQDSIRHNWRFEGIDAKVLIPGQPWQTGKVRLTMEFCPDQPHQDPEADEPETDADPELETAAINDMEPEPENPGSLLDDIRETLLKNEPEKEHD